MASLALVTGGNGFAASHLCRKLAERGNRVRALVRRTSRLDSLRGLDVELVVGDLATGDLPSDGLKGVDVVYHLAAAYRKEGVSTRHFYDVNVAGTELLLKAALQADAGRFVHCSTAGVQGDVRGLPADETAPYNPGDEYQRSKLEGELRALAFFRKQGLPGVVVRPVGIYGPGDTRFLKLFRSIDRGWFCMLGRGDVFYHLTYVEDLVEGMILAGEREEAVGEIFTLAGNEYVTLNRLVRMIADALGRPVPRWRLPAWPFVVAAVVCQRVCRPLGIEPPIYPRRLDFFLKNRAFDNSKAKRLLGFEPRVDIRTGLALTAKWYRANGYL